MWYFDTPIGRAIISRDNDQSDYCFSFNGHIGDYHRDPEVLADNAFCHCVGVWEWDRQYEYDVPNTLDDWLRG
ncbi:MAG: hypothetical protein IKO76_06570 [Butyrivibrio sp.]|nr:hypothetical protein [Butyrivibrio sp.]